MILTLAVAGYRSVRNLVLPLDRLTVITGPNGSGKTSLYRALHLLAEVAQGRAISALAQEGGLGSTLWAGPETISRAIKSGEQPVQGTIRKKPISLKLGFAGDDYGYAIELGLPAPSMSAFSRDPEIKVEVLWAGEFLRRSNEIARRNGPVVKILSLNGSNRIAMSDLAKFDSMMTHAADPQTAPELVELRERMRSWRFYDQLRSDRDTPSRKPQIGTFTPCLADDGSNLAAALQTIKEIGDIHGFNEAIDDAFPGCSADILIHDGQFEICFHQPGLLRPLRAAELSDGTLRYLLLATVMFSPRPAPLVVLNEPETSLHPDLLLPLSRLIHEASERSQLILVTHSKVLVDALADLAHTKSYHLKKELGETTVETASSTTWVWPER